MATTTTQDREFINDVISKSLLEESIEWITKNIRPDEVFLVSDLKNWANEKECEEIFSIVELETWAENNGYIKQD
jgi:hypothetical protein